MPYLCPVPLSFLLRYSAPDPCPLRGGRAGLSTGSPFIHRRIRRIIKISRKYLMLERKDIGSSENGSTMKKQE
jgi:hypothetical protein